MTPYELGAIAALQKLGQFAAQMAGAVAKAAPKAAKKLTKEELAALAKKKFLPGAHFPS
jgi:hypothetical protein